MRREELAGCQLAAEHAEAAEHSGGPRSRRVNAYGEERADRGQAAGEAKCLPQQNRGRRGPARP